MNSATFGIISIEKPSTEALDFFDDGNHLLSQSDEDFELKHSDTLPMFAHDNSLEARSEDWSGDSIGYAEADVLRQNGNLLVSAKRTEWSQQVGGQVGQIDPKDTVSYCYFFKKLR